MGRISTHVLDTSRGVPAVGVAVDLDRVAEGERKRVTSMITNADGRTNEPLLQGEGMRAGTYELTFHAGDYLRKAGVALSDPPFLDEVIVRFAIADVDANYHVPLLLSPYGYSTYRGS